jgi:hypothetical protein
VNSRKKDSCKGPLGRSIRILAFGVGSLIWLNLGFLLWGFPALAQSQQPPPGSGAPTSQQLSVEQSSGSINGSVVDPTGAAIAGARVRFTRENPSITQDVLSGDDGQFSFAGIVPGPFQVTITAEGFATQALSGILHQGEIYIAPKIALALAAETTVVRVVLPRAELAQAQIKEQEKQRVLGFIPNFYVSYVPNAVPLNSKQKFELAWRTTVDPVTFVLTGAIAGVQQAQNDFGGYGQGAQGYGKRFGAAYADVVTGTFLGDAILPSLLKQDPRYFYKGSGSARSRFLYAIANSVMCKGDNGHWQVNYSYILGNLAAGGISNLYYPASDRNGAELTFENTGIRIGANAAANLLQEFVIRKVTPKLPNHDPSTP